MDGKWNKIPVTSELYLTLKVIFPENAVDIADKFHQRMSKAMRSLETSSEVWKLNLNEIKFPKNIIKWLKILDKRRTLIRTNW